MRLLPIAKARGIRRNVFDEEYKQRFGDCIGTMMVSVNEELNAEIRECLRTGKPYDYGVPEDAIF